MSCILQDERVQMEREECTTCAKALWWEGTRRVHVSERRQPRGRSIEEGRIVWEGDRRGGLGSQVEEVGKYP